MALVTFLIHKTIPELHSDQDFYPMAELSEKRTKYLLYILDRDWNP